MTSRSVQSIFKMQSSVSRSFSVQKGQQNHYRIRPAILNEHVESARSVQGIVSSGNIVGQIFRASQDNINGISLSMESAAGDVFDNFETYSNSAELQAAWVEDQTPAVLETVIVAPGGSTKSMKIDSGKLNDEWVKTITATDYTDYSARFKFRQEKAYGLQEFELYIGDGTNTKSFPIVAPITNEWFTVVAGPDAFVEDGAGTTDTENITKIGIRNTKASSGSAYVDEAYAVPPGGSVKVRLFDMGTEIPVSGLTEISDGDQYTTLGDVGINGGVVSEITVDLEAGGKREYNLTGFVAGAALEIPGNNLLTPGNYHAITINYVDTDVSIYGPNPAFETKYYSNGYAFTAGDESSPIEAIGPYGDIHFMIFSTDTVFMNNFKKKYNSEPGTLALESIRIENDNMMIEELLCQNVAPVEDEECDFGYRTLYLPKGGKFEVNHADDYSDMVSAVRITIGYLHRKMEVYG